MAGEGGGDEGRGADAAPAEGDPAVPDRVADGGATVAPGRYRHYKGPEYEVLSEARHSETEEVLVVYRALYGERGLWVRPKTMWLQTVEVDGVARPRFQKIAD